MSADKGRPAGNSFPIAIVGLACRFPGAASVAEFWSLLESGADTVNEIPSDRWDAAAYYHPDPAKPGRMYTRAGGFIDNIDRFDAEFFGITPREARCIDPQQRMLLQLTWEALESAGIVPAHLAGSSTGVFVGISYSDYGVLQRDDPKSSSAYVMSGSAISNAANRLSYIFDLHGPSYSIDTACSSSLVAVHQACVSLWRGESSFAIVAGTNALLSPVGSIGFCKAQMLSPSGRCRSFDASADGYVRSEGAAVFILQPLDRAVAEKNPVYATIAGSGVNSDGRTPGLSMPNATAQEALLRQVYRNAGIDPGEVVYVEAHGTGTRVGDPVECRALGRVFGAARRAGDPCRIGSVKSNIGHLESASGVAGLLKVVLATHNRAIPRSLHCETPNPDIPFDELNLSVAVTNSELPNDNLTMGVNSFGFGGTNAHIIVRQAPSAGARATRRTIVKPASDPVDQAGVENQLLMISARSTDALSALTQRYAETLRSQENYSMPAFCANAARRRAHHPHRLALFGRTRQEFADQLEAFAAGDLSPRCAVGHVSNPSTRQAFVFSGNGSQWLGMGHHLVADPILGKWIKEIDAVLAPFVHFSVAKVLAEHGPADLFDRTEIAQPALFALQVAIFEWLRERGVEAEAVVGHSVGEVAAAYAAGIFSLADSCRLIAGRSHAQAGTAGTGRMAAVGLSFDDAVSALAGYDDHVTIAAVNSPKAVTVAGDATALSRLGASFEERGVYFRLLPLNYAFHSRCMDPIHDMVLDRLTGLVPNDGHLRFVSTVTGDDIAGGELTAEYWWRNIRNPVQFGPAISKLMADGFNVFIEIGPHPVLSGYIRETAKPGDSVGHTIPTLRRNDGKCEALWQALGRCYAAGATINLDRLYPAAPPPVPLPTYPWQGERYWYQENGPGSGMPESKRRHPLLGKRLMTADATWLNEPDTSRLGWLADHVIQGTTVMPGAAYFEMAVAAVLSITAAEGVDVEGLEIRRPLLIPAGKEPSIEIALSAEDGSFRVRVAGLEGNAFPPFVVGRAMPLPRGIGDAAVSLSDLRVRMDRHVDGTELYHRFAANGLTYGPAFRGVAEAWGGNGEALGRIIVPAAIKTELEDYRLHPAILDACLQVTLATVPEEAARGRTALIPSTADRIRFYGRGENIGWCYVTLAQVSSRSVLCHFRILDDEGKMIVRIDGLRLRRVDLGKGEIPTFHWRYYRRPLVSRVEQVGNLPGPKELAAAASAVIAQSQATDIRKWLNRLAATYAREALAALGSTAAADDTTSKLNGHSTEIGPNGFSVGSPIIERLVALLEHNKIEHGEPRLTAMDRPEPAEVIWRRALIEHPAHFASLDAIARWGEHLGDFINSEINQPAASDSERNLEILEQLYDSDPLFRCANERAASLVRHLCRNAHDRSLRILEVDGATAGFTASLLPALSDKCAEYLFTDPGETAVARAKARFAGLQFLRCEVLDLNSNETAPVLSNFSYDVVVVAAPYANLARVKAALKPGGLLIATIPRHEDLLNLAFAQLAGQTEPMATNWRETLTAAGFEEVTCVDDDRSTAARRIILARNPAVVPAAQIIQEMDSQTWVVFAKDAQIELVATTMRLLALQGHRVVLASEASAFQRLGLDRFELPIGDTAAYAELLRALAADGGEGKFHLLYLRGATEPEPVDALAIQERGCVDLFTLVQALISVKLPGSIRLTLVTCGATPASESKGETRHPWQAPLLGFARTLMNERPDFGCRIIDLDPDAGGLEAGTALIDEILHPDLETEIARRGELRFAPRLVRGAPSRSPSQTGEMCVRLVISREQGAPSAVLRTIAIPHCGDDEVTVRVRAAGLNFRDVLQRIGLLPEEAFEGGFAGATLGMEFAGEIIEVGRCVDQFRPGDFVFGLGRNAFSSHLVAPASGLYAMPDTMSFEDAATLPVALITVHYSLHHIARLRKGERILIHGAAGGVGLAAIQYAQSVGAEIFASAGTPEKRNFLRRLGVQHVVDSRTLGFADDIMNLTNGEGIDVVLNSVAGEAIRKGLSILRPHGRFIELGKRDFYANSKIGLQPFRNNIHFFGVDLDRLLADRPDLAKELFAEIRQCLAEGAYTPLPHRVFPVGRADEAFRCMQHSRHIGKIVLRMDAADSPPATIVNAGDQPIVSSEATYLVVGGRGGFGLATTEWLAQKGARNIAVVGRSLVTAPDGAAVLDRLRSSGINVCELSVDIADQEQVAEMFERLRRTMPQLRGIIHCAAVIQDFALSNMTLDNFREVLRPKIGGAWNLHLQSLAEKLDFFVMYSSGITLFGNEGQANYAAANLFLEALASYRHGRGLPALAVGWGTLSDVGRLTRSNTRTEKVKERLERLGVQSFSSAQALDRLERAIEAGTVNIAIAEMSWSRLAALPGIAKNPKYALVRGYGDEESGEEGAVDLEELRAHLAGLNREDAVSFIQSMLTKQIGNIVGMAPTKISIDRPLMELGMDSLMIVELQIGLDRHFGIVIPTLELVDMSTVAKLGRRILDELGLAPEPSSGAAPPVPVTAKAEMQTDGFGRAPKAAPDAAFEATLGRVIERELDRAKELPL